MVSGAPASSDANLVWTGSGTVDRVDLLASGVEPVPPQGWGTGKVRISLSRVDVRLEPVKSASAWPGCVIALADISCAAMEKRVQGNRTVDVLDLLVGGEILKLWLRRGGRDLPPAIGRTSLADRFGPEDVLIDAYVNYGLDDDGDDPELVDPAGSVAVDANLARIEARRRAFNRKLVLGLGAHLFFVALLVVGSITKTPPLIVVGFLGFLGCVVGLVSLQVRLSRRQQRDRATREAALDADRDRRLR